MTKRTIQLRECNCLQAAGVQTDQPVIQRVKVLGWESKNRRRYLPESVQPSLYEGMLVNIDHPDTPNASRRLGDRFGRLVNVTVDGDGTWADLHYNPAHRLAEQIKWAAEHDPGQIGLSHNAVGTGHTEGGVFIVEKVVSVRSVDLVADPATTKGLYESMDPELDTAGAAGEADGEATVEERIGHLVLAILKDDEMDLREKRKKILKALKLMDDGEEKEDAEEEDAPGDEEKGDYGKDKEEDKKADDKEYEESVKDIADKNPAVRALVEKLDRLEAERAFEKKQRLAHELCEAAHLPAELRTNIFIEQLLAAKDEASMKKLIEDRKQIASIKKPISSGKGAGRGSGMTTQEFARRLKGGK